MSGQEDNLTLVEARPPGGRFTPILWLRERLFSSIGNALLTLLGVALIVMAVPPLVDWLFIRAVWQGDSGAACRIPDAGACWPYIDAWFSQFVYYQYDAGERWRVNVVFALMALGLAWLMIPRLPAKNWVGVAMLFVFPVAAFVLLTGGWFGLPAVPTGKWGGFFLTIVIAGVAIVASLPLGVMLALGRRSQLPVIRIMCASFIEVIRGLPLVAVLFVALYILPLFLPPGTTYSNLAAALVAISLFSSAYMAEVIRGGLQAVPRGQYEASAAMGLGYWRTMGLVVLPQALKISLPSIVSNIIGIFKDTSLVAIIGLTDLLQIAIKSGTDPVWNSPSTAYTGYIFAALIYWCFCFGMSRYSAYLENTVGGGKVGAGKT
jgi:general L-amino acid transport system permease protein